MTTCQTPTLNFTAIHNQDKKHFKQTKPKQRASTLSKTTHKLFSTTFAQLNKRSTLKSYNNCLNHCRQSMVNFCLLQMHSEEWQCPNTWNATVSCGNSMVSALDTPKQKQMFAGITLFCLSSVSRPLPQIATQHSYSDWVYQVAIANNVLSWPFSSQIFSGITMTITCASMLQRFPRRWQIVIANKLHHLWLKALRHPCLQQRHVQLMLKWIFERWWWNEFPWHIGIYAPFCSPSWT